MKSIRRIGCWMVIALMVALGTLVILFTPFRQERGDFSGREMRGNVAFLGGGVTIGQDEHVKGNLLVVGDYLTLKGQIGGNLVVVGGDVELAANSRVGGNLSVIGGNVEATQASQIGGNIAVVGGDASLTESSRVGGNVRVLGGKITEEPSVQIGGSTSWRIYTNSVAHPGLYGAPQLNVAESQAEFQEPIPPQLPIPPQREAQIATAELQAQAARIQEEAQKAAAEARSQVAQQSMEAQRAAAEASAQLASHRPPWFILFLGKLAQAFLWTLLTTGLVLLFAWLLPKQVERITQTAQREAALSFATGAIVVMGSALLAAILTITICFALLALPLLALLTLVLLCGWTVTCCWLGSRLDEFLARQSALSWNPLVSIALSSLLVTGVTTFAWALFACLGFFVALLIGSTGTGAVIVHLARWFRSSAKWRRRLRARIRLGSREEPALGVEPTYDAESPAAAAIVLEANEPSLAERAETGKELELPVAEEPTPPELRPEDAPLPNQGDDLTRLVGIGPSLAQQLRDAGVTTFSQLAALDAGQIAEALGWSWSAPPGGTRAAAGAGGGVGGPGVAKNAYARFSLR